MQKGFIFLQARSCGAVVPNRGIVYLYAEGLRAPPIGCWFETLRLIRLLLILPICIMLLCVIDSNVLDVQDHYRFLVQEWHFS